MLAWDILQDKPTIDDFYRGDSVVYELKITKDDGSPVDLQSQVIWMSLQKRKSTFPELQLRFELSDTDSYLEQGITYLYLPYDKTNELDVGLYEYDVQLVLLTGGETMIKTIQKGSLYVLEDITEKES